MFRTSLFGHYIGKTRLAKLVVKFTVFFLFFSCSASVAVFLSNVNDSCHAGEDVSMRVFVGTPCQSVLSENRSKSS